MTKPEVTIRLLVVLLIIAACISISIGRYIIPLPNTLGIIASQFLPINPFWTPTQEAIILNLRLPRLILGIFIGAGLASSGAALQGVFINPLVSPFILGVASGAGFGGVLALLLFGNTPMVFVFAFLFGFAAMLMAYLMSRLQTHHSTLFLVLAGIIVSTLFTALTSLVKIIADPIDQLPSIVFWLMGSLASATFAKVTMTFIPITIGITIIYLLRFRLNLLSLGDEDARSLGVNPSLNRWIIITATTIIVAAAVAVSGVIGWVGLVIPHLGRMIVGPDHKVLIPVTIILGSIYLITIDTLSRTITPTEIPIGILTAIIGAVIFAIVSRITYSGGQHDR